MDDDHPADIGRPRRQGDRITPLFVAAAYDGYGTKRTCRHAATMVALGGKADISKC